MIGGQSLVMSNAAQPQVVSPLTTDHRPLTTVLNGLASLVDKSLLQRGEGINGEPRFTMLETIREYALERLLASGEADSVRRRHAQFFLALYEHTVGTAHTRLEPSQFLALWAEGRTMALEQAISYALDTASEG